MDKPQTDKAADIAARCLRQIDFETFNAKPGRFNQRLLDRSNSDIMSCAVNYVRNPPFGGTPGGEHMHDYDQFMFLISGKMMVQIDGEVFPVSPGTLMVFPAGVPHHFWNLDEETLHLTIMAPAPDPEKPRATQITS
jgi:mannose-6-phosphate isomerase-like protein (cupin superfamily)